MKHMRAGLILKKATGAQCWRANALPGNRPHEYGAYYLTKKSGAVQPTSFLTRGVCQGTTVIAHANLLCGSLISHKSRELSVPLLSILLPGYCFPEQTPQSAS